MKLLRCSNCGFEKEVNSNELKCDICNGTMSENNIRHSKFSYLEEEKEIPQKIELLDNDKLKLQSGEYKVKRKVGVGGFGTIYLIEKKGEYALKILDLWKKRPNEWTQLKARFKQSCLASNFSSKNLVKTFSNGFIEGNPYMIMEYCSNGNLSSRLDEFTFGEKFHKMGVGVLEGLNVLHEHGVIHRDVKPENILFDKNDMTKLTDFDISVLVNKRETVRNWMGSVKEVWGTAVYAPPEQLDHRKAFSLTRPSLDLFAFGVTMYETLTNGNFPFGSFEEYQKNPMEYYTKVKNGKFVPIQQFIPKISDEWAFVINNSLNPNPEKRLQSAKSALEILSKNKYVVENKVMNTKNNSLWIIKIMNGTDIGKEYNLSEIFLKSKKNILTIGWGKEYSSTINDIVVLEENSNFISNRHATIELHGHQLFLRDGQFVDGKWKNSLNGTLVNSIEVKNTDSISLNENDIITIGDTTMKIIKK